MSMKNTTAIITGAGRDIGQACALRLAAEGANVVLSYHSSSEGAENSVKQITENGGSAIAVKADLTKQEDVNALVKSAVGAYGKIDTLVNNSGGLVARKTIAEMSVEHWQHVMALNCTSIFLMIKACLPHMEKGSIINIASQAARDGGGPGAIPYASSKGAVMTMTRGMAKELGPDIRVNAICPGMIDTDFHNIFTKPEVRTNVAGATPLKREGIPDDVANMVWFLASAQSSFVTGANYDLNGGLLFS